MTASNVVRAASRRCDRWSVGIVALCLALAACGGSTDKFKPLPDRPVESIYNEAQDKLAEGEFILAAKMFDEVDRQHPYSTWAVKAQLMSAFSYYQASRYTEAITALDRFIQLQPGNPDISYAYYLRALCNYEQISDVSRDQKATQEALNALEEVTKRFPQSKYARDARLKADLTRDHLAGKDMNVGRFYQKQRQYLAAINRFRSVVEKYQTTTHVPEALHRLVECYVALGVREEAQMAAAVLGHNFPGSDWYQDSYKLLAGDIPRTAPGASGRTVALDGGAARGDAIALPPGQGTAGQTPAGQQAPRPQAQAEEPKRKGMLGRAMDWLF
ncbi:MAG: outer membrane protein assembly factor BamD [Alphaproteobacteria bacterium]|nr:outer membrane protein assembly factor BamD [Alphaproteobacteria bacterium]